jgi:hypothetical protein
MLSQWTWTTSGRTCSSASASDPRWIGTEVEKGEAGMYSDQTSTWTPWRRMHSISVATYDSESCG